MQHFIISAVLAIGLVACSSSKKEAEMQKEIPYSAEGKSATVFTTAENTDFRLSKTGDFKFTNARVALESGKSVFVNPHKTFQTLIGIGGAITDASAEVFAKLPKEKQEELLNAYYSKEGINYSLMRLSIHSADFGSESFTYVSNDDPELTSFNIDHDRKFRLPMILRVMKKTDKKMLVYASPWSPPAFMKTNGNMLQGGKLLPKYYKSWANYYAKFIKAYEKEGIPIWGVTLQNEPMAVQRWESCIYTAEEERDFLKNFLGPILKKRGYGDKNIVVWDHNRDLMVERANVIFNDPEASKYAWGLGFHWYENWSGGEPKFNNMQAVQEAFPDKKLLFTEGCNEAFDAAKYQYWPNAERYGRAMINDFNCGTVGWTDWNILLNEKGGPNHVGNYCFAPIHANSNTGELIYTPSYYYIGHFSKFLVPGAKRVSTATSISFLQSTTFQNPDGDMVTVVMNDTDNAIDYSLYVDRQMVDLSIPARAMQTVVY